MFKFIIYFSLIYINLAFSKFYKKCRIGHRDRDLANYTYETVIPSKHVKNTPTLNNEKQLQFIEHQLINYGFIDAGASGQVFLMQNIVNDEFKILKRYFKQGRFEQQNFVMHKMNYSIQWSRDPVYNNTMSIFPFTNSKTLYQLALTYPQTKIVMYKIVLELKKAHDMGFFHMDIKPLNILVDAPKKIQQQLYQTQKSHISIIDWNLVNFYYEGAEYLYKRGTACYQAPQLLLWSKYFTPAIDIWSLGVTFFYMQTGKKPYRKCSKQPIKSIIKFVGYKQFMKFYKGLGVEIDYTQLLKYQKLKNQPGQRDQLFKKMKQTHVLNEDDSDMLLKMLEIDPAKRISLKQLLQHKAFKNIRQLPQPYYEKQQMKRRLQLEKQKQQQQQNQVNEQINQNSES